MPKIAIFKVHSESHYEYDYTNRLIFDDRTEWREISQEDLDLLKKAYLYNNNYIIVEELNKHQSEMVIEDFISKAREEMRIEELRRLKNQKKEEKRRATLERNKKKKEQEKIEQARALLKEVGEL